LMAMKGEMEGEREKGRESGERRTSREHLNETCLISPSLAFAWASRPPTETNTNERRRIPPNLSHRPIKTIVPTGFSGPIWPIDRDSISSGTSLTHLLFTRR
jgi:hypothetical protein